MRWLFLMALASCYSPAIAPCRLACAGTTCPDGLVCNNEGMCAESESATCTMAGFDGGDGNDVGGCGWPMISNVDPCPLGAGETERMIDINSGPGMATINTDSLVVSGISGLTLQTATQLGTPANQVVVAVAKTWLQRASTTLTITGSRPLIIVADMVMINGPINVAPAINDAMCPTRGQSGVDVASPAGGGGGGGGGFGLNATNSAGKRGGNGGNFAGPPSATGGPGGEGGDESAGAMAEMLRPLRGGCSGGRGGSAGVMAVPGGTPGLGGGAIQISARTSIRIAAPINAPGGGGGPGSLTTPARSGAGGGGAGGAILLEAPAVDLMGGALCANGGGGGGTGGSEATAKGQTGSCTNTPAMGGSGTTNDDGLGGSGATGGTAAKVGTDGAPVAGNPGHGGGGGGGSVGRIRVNGTITNGPSTVTPEYTTGTF